MWQVTRFVSPAISDGFLHCPLYQGFVDRMATLLSRPRVSPPASLGEDELPPAFAICVWILAGQRVRQIDTTVAVSQILLLDSLHVPQVFLQGANHGMGHCRHPVLVSLSLANGNLTPFEVQVLHAQAKRLEQS